MPGPVNPRLPGRHACAEGNYGGGEGDEEETLKRWRARGGCSIAKFGLGRWAWWMEASKTSTGAAQ